MVKPYGTEPIRSEPNRGYNGERTVRPGHREQWRTGINDDQCMKDEENTKWKREMLSSLFYIEQSDVYHICVYLFHRERKQWF